MDEAERLCDRLAIVDHGKIIAEGTPATLIASLGANHVVEFSVDPDVDRSEVWSALPGVESMNRENGVVSLNVRKPHLTIPALLEAVDRQGAQLLHLSTRQCSLEDVFVHLTGRHLRED